ncbi:hypothetical protein SAMN05444004_1351 [Jannaschia faecimaris]|uniref:Uncharacterized protein n=1 Tax=Jannaschia faecimaris TaxID=1244108 RepID=A0A1H3UII6_9RHOB|nr:hypothetical protein [Jannaschia faecimaris]SDZ61635.1 hypothetical protein SAMN05444004_1351 [Jannaschia faecimaris]
MKHTALLVLVFCAGLTLLYLSRFWFLDLWPRSGLFGWEALPPDGGVLGRWLRGTPFAAFELLIWAAGVFMVLTYLQRLIDFMATAPEGDDHDDP